MSLQVADFFERTEDLYQEMLWQKRLRDKPTLFWVSRNWQIWETIALNEAIIINLLVAFFYPFSNAPMGKYSNSYNSVVIKKLETKRIV